MNFNKQIKCLVRQIGGALLLMPMIAIASDLLLVESAAVNAENDMAETAGAETTRAEITKNISAAGEVNHDVSTKSFGVPTTNPAPVVLNSTSSTKSSWTLTAEQWENARNGETILSLPVLSDLVGTWLSATLVSRVDTLPRKNEIIEIQYPGGEEGEFWVQQLTNWLVALGIPSSYMLLTPASGADDEIKFQLNRR